jgi:hypothetical protein
MALLFMDGFEAGDAAIKWPASAFGGSSTATTRYNTGRSWFLNNFVYTLVRNITPSSTVTIGVAMRAGGTDANASNIAFLADSGATMHLNIRITGANQIGLYTGATLLTSYTHTSSFAGNWFYFEMSGTIADAGGTCTVKIDGVQVISFTGDTKNAGTSTNIDAVRLSGSNIGGVYVDDVYVLNSTGSAPYNTFLGDVRINTLIPTAAGSDTGFSSSAGANYTTVDELPYSATDYVSATASGTRDLYTMGDITGSYSVLAVQNNLIAKKTDAGGTAIKSAIKSGGTIYYGSNATLTANDALISDLRVTDPATATTWTTSGVNALEAGMEIA